MGVCESVGTTHFAFMLANCMANGLKADTAVVEYGSGNDFLRLQNETKGSRKNFHEFTYAGIDFYYNVHEEKLTEIFAMGYEAIILDMKYGSKEVMNEFLRSDKRIVVAGLNLWQADRLKRFLVNEKLASSHYLCAALSYDRKLAKNLRKEYGVLVEQIPVEQNPFELSSCGFMKLLEIAENAG